MKMLLEKHQDHRSKSLTFEKKQAKQISKKNKQLS